MKPSGHTLATPELDLTTAFRLFAKLGLTGVEIVQDDTYHCGLANRPDAHDLAELRDLLDSLGLAAVHVTPYIRTLDSIHEGTRRLAVEALMVSVESAAAIGASGVRVLAGRSNGSSLEARVEAFVTSLREVSTVAERAGVSLNLESKGWSFAASTNNVLQIIAQTDSKAVGILFDPANLLLDGFDPVEMLADQQQMVRHLHVKDVRVEPGGAYSTTPLGSGDVPWQTLLAQLTSFKYNGYLSLEYERRWNAGLPPAVEALPLELTNLQSRI